VEEDVLDGGLLGQVGHLLTDLLHRAKDDRLALAEDQQAVADLTHQLQHVRGDDDRGAVLLGPAQDRRLHVANAQRIQPGQRFVAEDRSGLVQEGAQLSDAEIDNLLFMPGFSTASEVSDLSGRGVGMDVVKSAILALGGRVTIQSEPGSGTTFTISLPLTLAVLDGMVIDVAQQTLVVPLNTITETLTLTENDIRALGPETSVIKVRNTFVPLLDLGAELGYRTPMDSYIGAIVLLIAQEDGTHAALVVDAIQDQRQVVIKGLQDTFGSVPGVAAATILGDGKIALILDPVDVIAHADGRTRCARANLQLAG